MQPITVIFACCKPICLLGSQLDGWNLPPIITWRWDPNAAPYLWWQQREWCKQSTRLKRIGRCSRSGPRGRIDNLDRSMVCRRRGRGGWGRANSVRGHLRWPVQTTWWLNLTENFEFFFSVISLIRRRLVNLIKTTTHMVPSELKVSFCGLTGVETSNVITFECSHSPKRVDAYNCSMYTWVSVTLARTRTY